MELTLLLLVVTLEDLKFMFEKYSEIKKVFLIINLKLDLNLDSSGEVFPDELKDPKGRTLRCSSRSRICDPTEVGEGTE